MKCTRVLKSKPSADFIDAHIDVAQARKEPAALELALSDDQPMAVEASHRWNEKCVQPLLDTHDKFKVCRSKPSSACLRKPRVLGSLLLESGGRR